MKTKIILLIAIISQNIYNPQIQAQTLYVSGASGNTPGLGVSTTGNIGIGVSNPSSTFQINDSEGISSFSGASIIINRNSSSCGGILSFYNQNVHYWTIKNSLEGCGGLSSLYFIDKNRNSVLTLDQNGKVGIGNDLPGSMLHIKTPNYNTSGFKIESDNAYLEFENHSLALSSKSGWGQVPYISWTTSSGTRQAYLGWMPYYFNLTLENGFNFSINGGNVLINKTSQTGTGIKYKLDVEGPIRAHEIVVNTTGADFVFEPTYKLRTLSELETFIQTNKHLPDIAPAKEMMENGVSAGEMQAKLLQKVEELTLYVIEQQKTIERQNQRIMQLEGKLNK